MEPLPFINYLRLSITDRCQLRCSYCTYWREWRQLPAPEILSYEELLRIAGAAAAVGIRKIRITGGEPLVRRGVVDFVRKLHHVPGLTQVCLTTNGVLLGELAEPLYEAGLRHLNLSLDTLRRDRYRQITGRDNFQEVWRGLERALDLGFHPLKINCVVLKGINDDELVDLALLARDHPVQVRFIELMPTFFRRWWDHHFLPMDAVRRRLAGLGPLRPRSRSATAGPARIFRAPGFKGELGFISPMSKHHCGSCNRLRLTASGRLRPCLFGETELDLKTPLRQGASSDLLESFFEMAISRKSRSSPFPTSDLSLRGPSMVSIGG
ncbi:MAG: GTP 3',8-cyclase MoaA [Deltaproteobacteria bacterium]|nr:GTP 3',8-cyclase MoaA [Deltaproteobacteria bacterium]